MILPDHKTRSRSKEAPSSAKLEGFLTVFDPRQNISPLFYPFDRFENPKSPPSKGAITLSCDGSFHMYKIIQIYSDKHYSAEASFAFLSSSSARIFVHSLLPMLIA
jgi:hypothetical protein